MASNTKHTTPSCLLIFEDDSLVCSYLDGSALELSACGSIFQHTQGLSSSENHPLLEVNRETIQQRSVYATSNYKAKLQYALGIRNRFALHPYIVKNLLCDSDYILETYADIKETRWMTELNEDYIDVLDSGGIRLRSLDECSSVALSANNQDLSVEYLCKIKDTDSKTFTIGSQTYCNERHSGEFVGISQETYLSRELETFSPNRHIYVWIIQHLSVKHCPLTWHHPLQLALKFKEKRISTTKLKEQKATEQTSKPLINDYTPIYLESVVNCTDGRHQLTNRASPVTRCRNKLVSSAIYKDSVKIKLPVSLPFKCTNSHHHQWRRSLSSRHLTKDFDFEALVDTNNCSLKLMIANGVVYRFFLDPVSSEIYPGDGSVVTLKDSKGQYFTHTKVNKDGSASEQMFTVNQAMLSNPQMSSIARMVNKASRLLNTMINLATGPTKVCWKVSDPIKVQKHERNSIDTLEERTVPGVGHFTAFQDGHLRIVFFDRTILNIDSKIPDISKKFSTEETRDIPGFTAKTTCEIILPNGQRRNISFENPPHQFLRYLKTAKEWAEWIHKAYSTTSVSHQEEYRIVQEELKKLQCFNYILEKRSKPGADELFQGNSSYMQPKRHDTTVGCSKEFTIVSSSKVHDVLHKTSQFIGGIDNLLHNK